ncbi:MAG: hypothetical protein ACTSP3_02255 [Candidatus Heimdallarchaeaceae archaeon]
MRIGLILKRLFYLAVTYLIAVLLILAFSILIYFNGPPKSTYYDYSWENEELYIPQTNVTYDVLFDQHSHTINGTEGKLTLKQSAEWHIALGFTAFAVTDHNKVPDPNEFQLISNEYKDKIIIVPGMEWTTSRIHLNFLGITEWNLKIPRFPTDLQIKEAIQEVHRLNGTVTANHLLFTELKNGDKMPSREQLLSWGVDFIEVINGRDYDYESVLFVEKNVPKIGMLSGTDMHSPDPEDGGRVHAWTALNITKSLQKHDTTLIFNHIGIENQGVHKHNKVYDIFRPFYVLGEGLEYLYLKYDNVYAHFEEVVVIVFITYSLGLFVVFEILLEFRRSVVLKKKKNKFTKKNRNNSEKNTLYV